MRETNVVFVLFETASRSSMSLEAEQCSPLATERAVMSGSALNAARAPARRSSATLPNDEDVSADELK